MAAAGTTTQLLAIFGLVLSPLITLGASDWSCADAQRKWERSKDHPSDRAELFSFAKATAVQNWTDGSRAWLNESSSVCEWEGVCCVPFAGLSRVTELHVERNGLSGEFPPTFTKMSKLRVLDVHLNNMTNFPPGIEKLNELQQAKFGRNPICGTAKEVLSGFAVLTNLTHFNCNFCCLSGEFPDILANKPLLEEMYWDGNNFTGKIPPSVGKLKALTKISFNLNSMSGPFPDGLAAAMQNPANDCRVGSDTDFAPYDTSAGSPERRWLLRWVGNTFTDCPLSPSVLRSACGLQGKGLTPSPLNCSVAAATAEGH